MRNLRNHILSLIICFFAEMPLSSAQPLMFKHLEISDGLANSWVSAIHKDRDGLMWFGTLNGLSRYDGYSFITYANQRGNNSTLPDNFVQKICEMPDGRMWILTAKGYTLFDKEREVFCQVPNDLTNEIGCKSAPSSIYVDSNNTTWLFVDGEGCFGYTADKTVRHFSPQQIGLPEKNVTDMAECAEGLLLIYNNGLIVCVDYEKLSLVWKRDNICGSIGKKRDNFFLFVDRENCIWAYCFLGIWAYDRPNDVWKDAFTQKLTKDQDFVHCMTEDSNGQIWIGKEREGIDIVDKRTKSVQTVRTHPDMSRSLSHNTVYALHTDRDGIVWVGTYKRGVSYYSESIYKFSIDNLGDITSVEGEDEHRVWLGTNNNGLMLWNNQTHQTEKKLSISQNTIVSILKTGKGDLWIGTFYDGLYRIDSKGKTTSYKAGQNGLISNNIWTITEDTKGNIWFGLLDNGLQVFNEKTNTFRTIEPGDAGMPGTNIVSSCMTDDRNMAVGTANNGVFILNTATLKVRQMFHEQSDKPIANNGINHLFCDSRSLLWIASRGGLDCFDNTFGTMRSVSYVLPDSGEVVNAITEDNAHNIWLTTTRKLIRLTLKKERDGSYDIDSQIYNEHDGLQAGEFNQRSIATLGNGDIVIGGLQGINTFTPERIVNNKIEPEVIFTKLSLFGHEISTGETVGERVLLPRILNATRSLTLDYEQNIINIAFASNNTAQPEKTRYTYKLEGFNDKWITLPEGQNDVSFTNLAPGHYTLHVASFCNNNAPGKASRLSIEVLPPFWRTWWAYTIYIVVGLLLVLYIRLRIVKKEKEKFRLRQIEMEITKQEEINNTKFRFFTNISHELRTPLTLIITPIEELLKKAVNDEQRGHLELIYRNANRLLMLVNQLLDFRKGEMSTHKLSLSEGDIVSFIEGVCDSFMLMAEKRRIQFSFFSGIENFPMSFDADKIAKTITNLLSNAFKFTPEGGRISVMIEHIDEKKEMIEIKVSDTGSGISDTDKEHIFERFYQCSKHDVESTGTGIGLSLVKDFVTLHKGDIEVYDNMGRGTVFVIHIPVIHVGTVATPVTTNAEIATEPQSGKKAEKKNMSFVLVVDDNEDFRTFMKQSLSSLYRIRTVGNGQEAWEMLQNESEKPDIVISDIMMPEMDGNELCRRIKGERHTQHIPVILLSARQTDTSKVEGLTIGADDYITKPFNMAILVLRINKLISLSQSRGTTDKIVPEPKRVVITTADEKMVDKAMKYVEDNIERTDLSVEELSRHLGMSRVHLYKKMLQLTGKSPIEFIRIMRLKRAAQLLRESNMQVAEVAFEVGFNSPKYFARYFKEEYGMVPSAYQERYYINK